MNVKGIRAAVMTAAIGIGMTFSLVPVKATQSDPTADLPKSIRAAAENRIMFKQDSIAKTSQEVNSALDVVVKKYDEGILLGQTLDGLAEVKVNGKICYVNANAFVSQEGEIEELTAIKKAEEKRLAEEAAKKKAEAEKKAAEEAAKAKAEQTMTSSNWSGSVLSPSAGVNYGPSGKETYYNLPMNGVVSIMRSMGNTDEYWVRADGVKMLGNYVMIAANLGIRPRGSLVPTSLGMGIVCDTGGFAHANPTQIDIAVAW